MLYVTEHRGGALPREGMPEQDFRNILHIRLPLLIGEDKALMALYLDSGHSFGQLARLTGTSPTTVARKIRRIARRLADPTYPLCLKHRSAFSGLELAIIRDYFVRGRSCAQISCCRGVTYYRARTTILKARELVHSAPQQSHRASDEEDGS